MLRKRLLSEDTPHSTVYYTTDDGKSIDFFTLDSSDIISHTQESNGEWKLVLSDNLTSFPEKFFGFTEWKVLSIRFENCENITHIGSGNIYSLYYLRSVDFTSLNNVLTISNNFLYGILNVPTIDLSIFTNVTSVGFSFLEYAYLDSLILPSNVFTDAIDDGKFTPIPYIKNLTLLGDKVHESLGKKFNKENGMHSALIIYVPHELVDAYRIRFPELSDRIQCILKENCKTGHFSWPVIDYPAIMYTTTDNKEINFNMDLSKSVGVWRENDVFIHEFSDSVIDLNSYFISPSDAERIVRLKFNEISHIDLAFPGDGFAVNWVNCKELDLSPFSKSQVGLGEVFVNLPKIEHIDLSPLSNLMWIESRGWFENVIYKHDIDFSPLSTLQTIKGRIFNYNCLLNIDIKDWYFKAYDLLMLLQGHNVLLNLKINTDFLMNAPWKDSDIMYIKNSYDDIMDLYPDYEGPIHPLYVWIYGKFDSNTSLEVLPMPEGGHIIIPNDEFEKLFMEYYSSNQNIMHMLYCEDLPDGIYNYNFPKNMSGSHFHENDVDVNLAQITMINNSYNIYCIIDDDILIVKEATCKGVGLYDENGNQCYTLYYKDDNCELSITPATSTGGKMRMDKVDISFSKMFMTNPFNSFSLRAILPV